MGQVGYYDYDDDDDDDGGAIVYFGLPLESEYAVIPHAGLRAATIEESEAYRALNRDAPA